MNKQELRSLIREELKKTLNEVTNGVPEAYGLLSLLADPKVKKLMSGLSDKLEPSEYAVIDKLYTALYKKLKEHE
jgi:hypothetical protein